MINRFVALAICIALSASVTVRAEDAKFRNNVLLITVDDLRTELNCYGASRAITPAIAAPADDNSEYDVVVYDGTPAGIAAAIAAKREGAAVVLLGADPTRGRDEYEWPESR